VDFLLQDGGVVASEWFSEFDIGESELEGLEWDGELFGLAL
jgi:hypothetical protein